MNIKKITLLFMILMFNYINIYCEINIIDSVEFEEAENIVDEIEGKRYLIFKIEILEFENIYFLKSYYRENNKIKYKIKRMGGI